MESQKEISKIRKILENIEKRVSKLEKLSQSEPSPKKKDVVGIAELTKRTGVSKDKIKELFDLEGDNLTVLMTSDKLGKIDKERTKNMALLVLLGYKCFFGEDEVLSQEIRRNIEENGIRTNNFATHLAEITPSFIRRKGKIRSPKTVYKITALGESTVRELIKKICTEHKETK